MHYVQTVPIRSFLVKSFTRGNSWSHIGAFLRLTASWPAYRGTNNLQPASCEYKSPYMMLQCWRGPTSLL